MAIYRGAGGSGNSNQDSYLNAVTAQAVLATDAANSTAADVVITNADVVLTHADVVSTSADVTQTNADAVSTGQDAIDTAADVVLAEADKVQTGLDAIATAADKVATNADAASSASSATTATTKAGEASTSASTAYNYTIISSDKADDAAASASTASTKATTATTQAGIATTKASEASTSASNAASSATSAATSAAAALVSENNTADKLPLAGGALTGPVTTTSTVDGRDVSVDGSKLDGIETNADVTDVTNVTAAGALMDSELTSIASVKALNQGVATTDSPTFGTVTANGLVVDGPFTSTGIDDNATTNRLTIANTGITALGGQHGLGNNLEATNSVGGAFSITDPNSISIEHYLRIGSDTGTTTGVSELQLSSYGNSFNSGGGSVRFYNTRYSNDVALINGTRLGSDTGKLDFYVESAGLQKKLTIDNDGLKFNGNTAAADALDDYEEGTWTPVYSPVAGAFSVLTMDVISAKYTKVGNLVTIEALFRTDSVTVGTASGTVRVGGLPFAASAWSSFNVGFASGFAGDTPISGRSDSGLSEVALYYRAVSNGETSTLQVTDFTTGASVNKNYVGLSGSYIV